MLWFIERGSAAFARLLTVARKIRQQHGNARICTEFHLNPAQNRVTVILRRNHHYTGLVQLAPFCYK